MGVVYRAYDPELDRDVALKSVRIEGADAQQKMSNEQYLAREARAAARLQHPHTVAVHDFFSTGDRAFIVMELVRGGSLEAFIAMGDFSDHAFILRVLRETAMALDAAHAAGIVHRDIKPGNILFDETGRVKIADFGIARLTHGAATTQTAQGVGTTSGTLSYMSPEQIRGEALDGRADQFSLAVVAYQIITGQLPFTGETWIAQSYKTLNEAPVPPSQLVAGLPSAVDRALGIALSKQAAERFPSCTAFVDALAGGTMAAAPAKAKKEKSRTAVLLLAPIVLLCTAVIGFLIWRGMRTIQAPVASAPAPVAVEPAAPPKPPPPAGEESLSLVLDGNPVAFAQIQPGRFVMGCNTCQQGQVPEHMVEISRGFQMGRTEVTGKQWNAVMTGKATGSDKPKVNISWNDTQTFLAKLNALGDGFHYRLPTEAEWEYCARAGDPADVPRNLLDVAWTSDNAEGELREVATAKMSNLWGLYDMLGNASEWVHDWVDEEYYTKSPARDPRGPASGTVRAFRGGNANAGGMVASYVWRFGDAPSAKGEFVGFRIVRERK